MDMVQNLKVKIVGTSPLIMHNGEGANPQDLRQLPDFLAKKTGCKTFGEAGSKLKKERDKNHELLAEVGFYSSLYLNKKNKVIYPSMCLERMMVEQSKAFKDGRATLAAKAKRAICVNEDAELEFENKDKPLKELFDLHRYDTLVKVSMAKTPRTRAMFVNWSCVFFVELLSDLISLDMLQEVLKLGTVYGSLERRPKYGRYVLKEFKKMRK